MTSISVAFDMTFANRNQGGSGVYARSLLDAVRKRDDVVAWTIEGPRRSNLMKTVGWLVAGGRKATRSRPPDVVHCPTFVAPWRIDVPIVITVHDAAVNRFPADHPLEWRLYFRKLMPERLKAAARVIAVSEFARSEAIGVYGLNPDKVIAIPEGLDARFLTHIPAVTGGNSGMILFPGAPIGRKNLDVVLRSLATAAEGTALARSSLHISGANEQDFPAYTRLIRNLGLQSRVRWLGQLPWVDLPALYAAASVVVYPSMYEGFGFPPLEAMAVGTPVVASNRGALPEVLGDSALLVDPSDPAAVTAALEAVLTNPELRGRLRAKGKNRASMYTWAACAAKTIEVYRDACAPAAAEIS